MKFLFFPLVVWGIFIANKIINVYWVWVFAISPEMPNPPTLCEKLNIG